jgi:exodeoxyribonuclease-5
MAGTGKTTVVADLISDLLKDNFRPALVAPTGKAVSVLNKKQSLVTARTIHSLLYTYPNDLVRNALEACDRWEDTRRMAASGEREPLTPAEENAATEAIKKFQSVCRDAKQSNTLFFEMRSWEDINLEADIIIVDEASMVGSDLYDSLLYTGLPIIFVGDPNQLMPVKQSSFSPNLKNPDAYLTDIMRQSEGSPVLNLSREVLKQKGLPTVWTPEISVGRSPTNNPLPFLERGGPDTQFIVYANKTRHTLNKTIRNHLNPTACNNTFEFLPLIGERLMVDTNEPVQRIYRGDIIRVTEVGQYFARPETNSNRWVVPIKAIMETTGAEVEFYIHLNDLMLSVGHAWGISDKDYNNPGQRFMKKAFYQTINVSFAYAITCHKAQGSEWDNVVLYNEYVPSEQVRYLYTGITRAKKKLYLAQVPR